MGDNGALKKVDRILLLESLTFNDTQVDTLINADTLMDGSVVMDTVFDKSSTYSSIGSSFSLSCLRNYFKGDDDVEAYSFFAVGEEMKFFENNSVHNFRANYVDTGYFNVFNYPFLEGEPFDKEAIENARKEVVMTRRAADGIFGVGQSATGREIEILGVNYLVKGVVENQTSAFFFFDLIFPYTLAEASYFESSSSFGFFNAAYLVKDVAKMESVKKRYRDIASAMPREQDQAAYDIEIDEVEIRISTIPQLMAFQLFLLDSPEKSLKRLKLVVLLCLLLFLIPPVLNLIKVNMGRVMDRRQEIGIRKAHGASATDIILQFLFENIFMGILGGVLGLSLALPIIHLLNETKVLQPITLIFNMGVFGIGVVLSILLGVTVGLFPAIKISKTRIAHSLNDHSL